MNYPLCVRRFRAMASARAVPAILTALSLAAAVAEEKEKAKEAPTKAVEAKAEEKKGAEAKAPEPKMKKNAKGETVLVVEREAQELIRLRVAPLKESKLSPEIEAPARILDPGPLAALLAELEQAKAAAALSDQEHARLLLLKDKNNVSARALQAAEAAALRDRLQVGTLRDRLALGWGKSIAERADLKEVVSALVGQKSSIARVDFSLGETVTPSPEKALLFRLFHEEHGTEARLLGEAPTVDPLTQGAGLFYLVAGLAEPLAPGLAMSARFKREAIAGVVVPRSSILRHEGKTWVYLKTGEEEFTRREVALAVPSGAGWLVTTNLAAKDLIVVSGGQILLSQESAGEGGE